jgi:hypothetical protein
MRRNKKGLLPVQGAVLKEYVDGEEPIFVALKKHKVARSLFWKWVEEDATFKREYRRALAVIAVSERKRVIAGSAAESEFLGSGEDSECEVSEREWVRSISGEEGVEAYDELVAMREAREKQTEGSGSAEGE